MLVPLLAMVGAATMRAPWGKREPDDGTAADPDNPTMSANPTTSDTEDSPDSAGVADTSDPIEITTTSEFSAAAELQVFAHTLIADLFGAGLRLQNLLSTAPDEMCDELESIADHLDKAIRDTREFAFTHRS